MSLSIVYDIASGTVGGALVELSEKKEPKIIYTNRQPILFQKKPDSQKLLAEMLRSLEKVTETIPQEGIIEEVFYVFSSPWVISQTKTFTHKENKEITVTHSFIKNLLQSQEKEIKFDEDMMIIEHKSLNIKLNGYEVLDPVGKKAHLIELPILASAISKDIFSKVENVVSRSFNFQKSLAHSFTLLSCSIINDIFPDEKDFMLIDVNGELTNMDIVRNGISTYSTSFPFGSNSMIRHISNVLNTEVGVSESLAKTYLNKSIELEMSKKLEIIFSEIQKRWLEQFNKITSPKKIFILMNNIFSIFLADAINHELFDIVRLDEEKLKNYFILGGKAKSDVALFIGVLSLNKCYNK
ncbi:MAG: hypothetical protein NUV47_03800 [Patescibacteria group bacterium]|nr:hypothetical protein [Patescibacteria group bacterium]